MTYFYEKYQDSTREEKNIFFFFAKQSNIVHAKLLQSCPAFEHWKSGIALHFFHVACGLIEDGWIFVSASVFNGMHYSVWVEVYEENLASHRYVVGKGTSILMVFLIWFQITSLIPHKD